MTFKEFLKIIYFIPLFEFIFLDTNTLWLCAGVYIYTKTRKALFFAIEERKGEKKNRITEPQNRH